MKTKSLIRVTFRTTNGIRPKTHSVALRRRDDKRLEIRCGNKRPLIFDDDVHVISQFESMVIDALDGFLEELEK